MLAFATNLHRTYVSICGIIGYKNNQLREIGGLNMIRCLKTSFRANKETIDRLFQYNQVSGKVWNRCLELAKKHHLKMGKWITKSELQKSTKGVYPIHSQSVQAVCHKYLFA
ncbi:hypothetical protein [Sporosarcina sp. FSL K6-3457]|uniref:hypothetical protein n=1 Tax=Sporosarcina sp. FSL K6-3457 TaxID=2978204 RepID=UPI0030F83E26